MTIKVTVMVQKEENCYVAKSLEDNIVSQGKTIEESLANLKEALELYYEEEKPEEVYDFVEYLKINKANNNVRDITLVSEASFAKDWLKPEEDEAWQSF